MGVTHLIVVPGTDLDELAHRHRETRVKDARCGVTDDIGRDEWLFAVVKVWLEGTLARGILECLVDLLDGCWLLEHSGEVGNRTIRNWYTQCSTVEVAVQAWDDLADCTGSPGRGWDDVDRGGASTTHVFVRCVDNVLIAGVTVRCGHKAVNDSELVIEDLNHRRKAVGRARCVRHHVVTIWVVEVIVDAEHEGGITSCRRGDENLLGASCAVHTSCLFRVEDAGRFDDDVDVEFGPRKFRWVALGEEQDAVVVDAQLLVVRGNFPFESAVDAVMTKQRFHRLDVAKVVDCNEVDIGASGLCGTEIVAADTAKAVDCYADGHGGNAFHRDLSSSV